MPLRKLSAPWLMVTATLLFALMGVCVKVSSAYFSTPLIVLMRGLVGAVVMLAIAMSHSDTLRTRVPLMHLKRGLAGTTALALWFYAIGHLPLATAVTLNYMSSVWMAVFMVVAAWASGGRRVDGRLIAAVLLGFAGVALVLQPTIERDQMGAGFIGLVSGMLSAMAYLQVSALGKAGEPEVRVVFYFSLTGTAAGALACAAWGVGSGLEQAHALPLSAWLNLLGVGLFATLAQLAMTRAYAKGRALVNANLQYLGIVHAFVFGVWLFGDSVTALALLGMLLIVGAGMWAARLRPLPEAASRPTFQASVPPDA